MLSLEVRIGGLQEIHMRKVYSTIQTRNPFSMVSISSSGPFLESKSMPFLAPICVSSVRSLQTDRAV